MRKVLFVLSVLVVFVPVAAHAQAMDLQPPWWRGMENTTSQYWTFSTAASSVLPPDGIPAGGDPWIAGTNVDIVTQMSTNPQWLAEDNPITFEYDFRFYAAGYGVWSPAEIAVLVDNEPPGSEPDVYETWLWIQLTWRPTAADETPVFSSDCEPAPHTSPPEIIEEILFDPTNALGWRETTYLWTFGPYSTAHQSRRAFYISGDVSVDELVIDTWVVPEPGVFALIGLGLLALLRRKK